MTAENKKIAELVGKIANKFDEVFSSHTADHNKIVSTKIDTILTSGDFQVDIECFNNISSHQLGVLNTIFLANGYRVADCKHDRWTARIDYVDVGVDMRSIPPCLEIFRV